MATFEYTAELTAKVVGAYVEAVEAGADYATRTAVVKALADELETSEASVRSKLVSERVYVAKEATAKEKDTTSKEAYIKALEAIVGAKLKSFDKATKADIKVVVDYITVASAQADAEAGRLEQGS